MNPTVLRFAFCCLVAACTLLQPAAAGAQRGIAREGALFLVLPIGARQAASGQSVAAMGADADQLYWNPAATSRATQNEYALHVGRFFAGPLISAAGVFPLRQAGVIGVTMSVLDYGTQETTDITGTTEGQIAQQSYVLAASYAATLGPHASLGLTYEYARFVGSCSGLCPPVAIFDVSTSAVSVGVQYVVTKDSGLVLAGALRHAGLRFQLNDAAQADPLPTRIQIGASYRLHSFDADLPGAQLRVTGDLIDRAQHLGDVAPRVGVDLSWRGQFAVRAGYVGGTGDGTGLGVGFGIAVGGFITDVARTLGVSSDAGRGATYVSVKSRW